MNIKKRKIAVSESAGRIFQTNCLAGQVIQSEVLT